jgi:hypothetical protein
MNSLLSSGATSSELLSEATTDAKNCSSPVLANDVNEIQVVRNQRNSELTQAQSLTVADLPNGSQLQADLIAALQDSLTADGHYLTWAQQQANPSTCVDNSTPPQAGADNARASADKNTFLGLWNPIAAQYSLMHRGTGDM